jgi:hypothetical protein
MPPLVGVRVGIQRRPQQRLSYGRGGAAVRASAPADVVAVRRVVGDRYAVAGLTDIQEPMSTNLEPREFPRGVDVSRTENVPELDLRRRVVRMHVQLEAELEKLLPLMPVDGVSDLQRRRPGR